jgi:hypothetical protein
MRVLPVVSISEGNESRDTEEDIRKPTRYIARLMLYNTSVCVEVLGVSIEYHIQPSQGLVGL